MRDRVFYVGVALFFAAAGAGLAVVNPVLGYECARDASGRVDCVVHRRVFGLVPLPDRRLVNVLAAEVETSSGSLDLASSRRREGSDRLVLVCADGTRWGSTNSSSPIGTANEDVARGVTALRAARSPQEFRAWQGETLPLLVGALFFGPLLLILLALLARTLIGPARVEATVAGLEGRRRPR